ncbi:hypothetical protein EH223_13875 [candidate division KSB1 bacterium]|nr:hypothetical protein [candidate division KSB1 bacterium]RQW01979.1 MAG: hypothetical protein EH223_13875 [candidate division KSB1 bacterium]
MKRRSFLKTIPAGIGMLTVFCSKEKNQLADQLRSTGDPLYENFRHPKAAARPFYRWWWNDNRVTPEEVRRELRLMAEQGAGGVEINPIALPEVYTELPGEKLEWLSRDWNDVLLAAVDEAKKLDMIVDLIVGTGWPFGGVFLAPDETIQGLELAMETIQGPVSLEKKIGIPDDPDHKIVQIKLFPTIITSVDDGIDLTYHIEQDNTLVVDIPNGEWTLFIVTWRNKFREVMFGAKGADGPVLDHFNKKAVLKYLNRMSDALNPLFGGVMGNAVRALFCDSIELQGANWTSDLAEEFRERFDYQLEPYLPLILAPKVETDEQFTDALKRVRYDFSTLLADLFMERFILPYHEWCLQNGVVSRYQAYGHPWLYTDLLDGYLIPDIPESDQWLYNAGWVRHHRIDDIRYAIWNKYASSGGHLTGKNIISCEAMTNTRGLWEATLEYIKQATDLNIVSGINHLVLHGFNYSPPEADFPGWIRFGTYFNENNTWWPYLKLWSDYAARLGQIFQDSQYTAQIAIMGPTPDVWSEHGLDRNPWNTTPGYLHDLWQALNHHGYCSDYVNATILQGAQFTDGKLCYGPMAYDLLICCDIQTIHPETAHSLLAFAENGGTMLFINNKPSRSPGYVAAAENDLVVQETMDKLLAEFPAQVKLSEYPEEDNLTTWIGSRLKDFSVAPGVSISNPDERLFMINHHKDNRDIYFFCNSHRERAIEFDAAFPAKNKTIWEWETENGEKSVYAASGQAVHIFLKPLQSLLLVLDETTGDIKPRFKIDEKSVININGPWDVEFFPLKEKPFEKVLESVVDFSKETELKHFSGTVTYKTTFPAKFKNAILDLGKVYDIAEVTLNDTPIGVRWWGEKQFAISDGILSGENRLEIKVTTTLFNFVQSLDDNAVVQYWLHRRKNKGLLAAGLVGPVRVFETR